MRSGPGSSSKRLGAGASQQKEDLVFYDFILSFFRYQGILYTKIGIDELEDLKAYMFKLMQEYFSQIDREVSKKEDINKIIHLSLCMIFCAHATIAEAIKDVEKQTRKQRKRGDAEEERKSSGEESDGEPDQLAQALKLTLPQMAVSQITHMLTMVIDRISQIPNPWLEALVPLITWLTLHKGDSLIEAVFNNSPTLKKDLARVHKLLDNFCSQEFKGKGR